MFRLLNILKFYFLIIQKQKFILNFYFFFLDKKKKLTFLFIIYIFVSEELNPF
jgi:hypothetical protein